jgi:hypothetical protein
MNERGVLATMIERISEGTKGDDSKEKKRRVVSLLYFP